MAIACQCDRCGKFCEARKYVPDIRILRYHYPSRETYYDLCDDCQKELESFIGYSKSKKKGE